MSQSKVRAALLLTGCLLVAAAARVPASNQVAGEELLLGSGPHRYRWTPGWMQLEPGALGNTHGDLWFDAEGNLYVNTDTERAVQVFAPDGRRLRSFGAEFQGGLHGMCGDLVEGQQVLWFAHTARHEVVQVNLNGELLRTIPWPEASGHYETADAYKPTGVAIGPEGSIYVADGYGAGWVHRFSADGSYLQSFGGPGDEPGQFRTPHGLWIDTRESPARVLVADREHGSVQRFTLDGQWLDTLEVQFRRPCQVKEAQGYLVVADLAGRVTVLDRDDRLVAHLGDNPDPSLRANHGVPPEQWRDGRFTAPHAAAWDGDGNLYVMDWNRHGRVSRLERVLEPGTSEPGSE